MAEFKTPRYTIKTVKQFMEYLDEMGLEVMGPTMRGNVEFPSLMTYDSLEIVERRRHMATDNIVSSEEE